MYPPEFGTIKEKEQFVGYAHNFERYTSVGNQGVDVLAQILQYGLISQREARRLGIPYRRPLVTYLNARDADDIIFLFPLRGINQIPRWPNAISLVFDRDLEVLSHEEVKSSDILPL